MSSELASGHVSIFPVMTGFKGKVVREVKGAGSAAAKTFDNGFKSVGARAGRSLGKDMKSALKSSAGDLGGAELKNLTGNIASASSSLARARLKQQDDAGKVRVAETKLAEAVAKYGPASSQAIAAEERLASARRQHETTSQAVVSASDRLTDAQGRLRAAQEAAAGASDRAAGGLKGLLSAAGQVPTRLLDSFQSGLAALPGRAASAFQSIVSSAGRAAASAGRAIGSGIKSFATAGVTTAAAGIGIAFTKGIGRLTAIDTAKAKLKGLGNDSKAVTAILGDALASVRGTSFGLGEAATVAASAVAANIKPGEQLQTHLKNIANNASAAGVSMSEMGSIFNKAATQANGVQNDVIAQLADKGIPIYQALADQMGVTAGEVFKMASQGKVDFDTFSKAATAAAGTVAQEMGKTVPGAAKNFLASLGRIGANALEGIYSKVAPLIQAATSALAPVEAKAKVFGEVLLKAVGPALDWITNLLNRIGEAGGIAAAGLGGFSSLLAPVGAGLAALGAGGLGGLLTKLPVVGSMLGGLAGPLAALGGPLGIAAAALAGFALSGGNIESLVSGITSVVNKIVAALPGMVQKVASFVPQLVQSILSQVPKLLQAGVQIVTVLIQGIVTAVPALVQGALSLIQGLVQALLTNLPLIVDGALALVTGLVQGLITALPLIVNGAVQLVTALVTGLVQMLPQIVQGGLTLLTGLLTAIVQAIPLIVNGLLQLLPQLVTTLLGMLPQLLQTGITLFVGLVQALVKIVPQLITTLVGLLPKIVSTITGMLPTLLTTGVKLFIQLVQAVVEVLPKLITQIIGMLPKIVSTVIGMLPKLLDAAVKLFMALVEALPVIIPELVTAIIDMAPKLVGAVIDMVPQLLNAGKDLIRGLIEGIVSMGSALIGAIGDLVGGAVNWAKDLLGIASPSKVFIQIGKFVGQGFVKGVSGTRAEVAATMSTLIDKVKSSYDKLADERKRAGEKLAKLDKRYDQLSTKIQDAKSIKDDKARARRLRDLRREQTDVGKQLATQRKLVKDYDTAINKGKNEKNLLKKIRTARDDLKDIASEREAVLKDLAAAREDLKAQRAARTEVVNSIRDAVVGRGDITGFDTTTDAIANLEAQLKATTRFEETLRKLKGLGLDDASRDQLVNAFKQSGSTAMADNLLSGGKEAIKRIGSLQSQLATAGKNLGKYVGDDMYKAGIDAAKGLVDGLKSQADDLKEASKAIGEEIARQIKKTLKIKSPSRVTRALGEFTGEGMALGLEDKITRVQRAADRMLPVLQAPAVPGASGAAGAVGSVAPGGVTIMGDVYTRNEEELVRRLDRSRQSALFQQGALVGGDV